MIKDKMDYKLINCAITMVIIFLLYKTGDLWIGILSKIWDILLPFLIAFVIAYALYPLVKFLINKKVPKILAILIVLALVFGVLVIFGAIVVPLLFNQLGSLFNSILSFINELSTKYDVNFGSLSTTLSHTFNNIITTIGSYISHGTLNVITKSISVIAEIFIAFAAGVYILADMDKIRLKVRKYLTRKNKRFYNYIALLDKEMHSYLSGFLKVMIISLFEYTIVYSIIGHPDAILLGCLAMIANLIPYFGGIVNNIIAAITAFVISPVLFVKTIVVFIILSMVDGYVINPLVYGKTNQIHPLVVIMSVFAGGVLFGIPGIIIALPSAIIIISTIKFFKDDVKEKIEDIRDRKEQKD